MHKIFTLLLGLCLFILTPETNAQIRVVILGSSTAEGVGASAGNSWASKYRVYLQGLNSDNEVINLAKSSYTTYHVMPNGNSVADRPEPDTERNITKALSLAPDVIIVNLPTNDADRVHTVQEIMDNYATIKTLADAQNVAVYYTSTQPRNFPGYSDKRELLVQISGQTLINYGANYIDFWTGIAETDGTIKTEYDSGDGIHLKDAAHQILFDRIVAVTSILTHVRSNAQPEYINVDFGNILTSATGWNAITNPQTGRNNSLINTENKKSGIYAWVHDTFDNVFQTGSNSVTGLPSEVSQDGFYGSGTSANNTGGVTLGGLSPNKKYKLTFFSSRASVGDVRETKISVKGQTTSEQTVNASNNASQFLVFEDIKADANGFIEINVADGANNSGSKFFYLNALQIIAESSAPVANPGLTGRILIDFGAVGTTTSGNWNNLTDAREINVKKDLINTDGDLTGYKLSIHDAFNAANTDGATNNSNYPANATSDSFYGNNVVFGGNTEPTGGVTLDNLDATKKYTLTFYGSRMGVADNRETQFTVAGSATEIVYLQTVGNQNNNITVADMLPDANGKIIVTVTLANNNNGSKFYYLGLMDIAYAPQGTLPIKLKSFKGSHTNHGVLLEWKTASETKGYFEVLRTESGVQNILGTLSSSGSGSNSYSFTDRAPNKGINYYQLNHVDIDGISDKSDIVSVKTSYPSLFKAWFKSETELQIQLSDEKGGAAAISLTDLSGRNILKRNLKLESGINEVTVRLNSVPSGIYVLSAYQNGKTESIKIRKN